MKLINYLKFFGNKRVAQCFLFLLLLFIATSFISEWRTASRTQSLQIENEQNYQAIATNVVLLNRCYVENPDESYCLSVLRVVGSQLKTANYNTENLKTIWFNCYMYLASVSLAPYPNLHDRIVGISVNEEVVGGNLNNYIPSTKEKIVKFQQELRASYRSRIELEANKRNKVLKNETQGN